MVNLSQSLWFQQSITSSILSSSFELKTIRQSWKKKSMDTSPRSPLTNSVADSPSRGGTMDDASVAGGLPMASGGSYPPGYPPTYSGGYFMGPPSHPGMGGGYGMTYAGSVGPPHTYSMHPHGPPLYANRAPPGASPPPLSVPGGNGIPPSPYGRYGGGYDFYGIPPGGSPTALPVKQHSFPQHSASSLASSPASVSASGSKTNPGGMHGPIGSRKDGGSNSKASPSVAKESRTDESPPLRSSTKTTDDIEMERAKASAEAELTLSIVKPIQTDFHFFVLGVMADLREKAEKEVKDSLTTHGDSNDHAQYTYLVNTNLNARLIKAWESLKVFERELYNKKEEQDRKRFMDEDEVASRHCATLTARVKSPGESGGVSISNRDSPKILRRGKGKKEKDESIDEEDEEFIMQASDSLEDEEKTEKVPKRPTGDKEVDDQSPSKKNRFEGGD